MTTAVSASTNSRPTIAAILAVSAAATLFLFWLIYLHPAADAGNTRYAFLPALNAIFNGLAATLLLIGYSFIRARRLSAHRPAMITAFVFSTLFLVSYIVHHALHVRYPAYGAAHALSDTTDKPHCPGCCGAAHGAGHVLLFAHRAPSESSQDCALDFPPLALCLGHRRHHLRDAATGARVRVPAKAAAASTNTADLRPRTPFSAKANIILFSLCDSESGAVPSQARGSFRRS